ncbi:hypothetical protein NLM24_48675 [Nocardia zapadnayensis]|nr:hypothetical protein [Nocardia zapadnayensis]MCX0278277.1 hypothetical protein [Nocardia zapadnayensis]
MSTDGPASEPPTAARTAPELRDRPGRGAGSGANAEPGHSAEPELRDPIEKLDAQRRTRRQNILVTLAWMLHWVLRMGPVKQLAGVLGVVGIIILLPFLPRLLRFAAGRATGPALLPTPIPWPRLARFTRWLGAIVAVVAVAGSGAVLVWSAQGISRVDGPLPGVYRVVEDAREPAAQLAEDDRWQQVAFGQWDYHDGRGRVGIRYANGDFQGGTYRLDGDTVTLSLDRIREGSQPLGRNDYVAGFDLTWEELPDGRIALTGDRVDIVIESDAEARYLFDRDFSWAPRPPINR